MMGFPLGNLRNRPFVVEPLVNADSIHLAKLHALTFSQPWSDEEFQALMMQGNVFGFIAREEGKRSAPPGGFVLATLAVIDIHLTAIGLHIDLARVRKCWRNGSGSGCLVRFMRGADIVHARLLKLFALFENS